MPRRPDIDRRLTDAQRDLVSRNLGLLGLVTKLGVLRRLAEGVGNDADARQIAAIGLMRAAQLFNPSRGQFSTYAVTHMRAALSSVVGRSLRKCRMPPGGLRPIEIADLYPAGQVEPPDPEAFNKSAWLDEAMRHLPGRQRRAIEMRRHGYIIKEIAAEFHVTRQRAHQLLQQAKERLSKRAIAATTDPI